MAFKTFTVWPYIPFPLTSPSLFCCLINVYRLKHQHVWLSRLSYTQSSRHRNRKLMAEKSYSHLVFRASTAERRCISLHPAIRVETKLFRDFQNHSQNLKKKRLKLYTHCSMIFFLSVRPTKWFLILLIVQQRLTWNPHKPLTKQVQIFIKETDWSTCSPSATFNKYVLRVEGSDVIKPGWKCK